MCCFQYIIALYHKNFNGIGHCTISTQQIEYVFITTESMEREKTNEANMRGKRDICSCSY